MTERQVEVHGTVHRFWSDYGRGGPRTTYDQIADLQAADPAHSTLWMEEFDAGTAKAAGVDLERVILVPQAVPSETSRQGVREARHSRAVDAIVLDGKVRSPL
jgi:hypothetical protein